MHLDLYHFVCFEIWKNEYHGCVHLKKNIEDGPLNHLIWTSDEKSKAETSKEARKEENQKSLIRWCAAGVALVSRWFDAGIFVGADQHYRQTAKGVETTGLPLFCR